nr:protein FAR1-RELATED SEQUENCE 5-like [Ipomoea trifida]
MVGSNEVRMTRLVEALKELKGEFVLDGSGTNTTKGNSHAIEALCGVKPPLSISIKPPAQAKNKGSGKRFKSKRELAIEAKARGENTMKDALPLAPANALRSLGGYLPLFFLYPVC